MLKIKPESLFLYTFSQRNYCTIYRIHSIPLNANLILKRMYTEDYMYEYGNTGGFFDVGKNVKLWQHTSAEY